MKIHEWSRHFRVIPISFLSFLRIRNLLRHIKWKDRRRKRKSTGANNGVKTKRAHRAPWRERFFSASIHRHENDTPSLTNGTHNAPHTHTPYNVADIHRGRLFLPSLNQDFMVFVRCFFTFTPLFYSCMGKENLKAQTPEFLRFTDYLSLVCCSSCKCWQATSAAHRRHDL